MGLHGLLQGLAYDVEDNVKKHDELYGCKRVRQYFMRNMRTEVKLRMHNVLSECNVAAKHGYEEAEVRRNDMSRMRFMAPLL
jgi:hypothetical protein